MIIIFQPINDRKGFSQYSMSASVFGAREQISAQFCAAPWRKPRELFAAAGKYTL
jgi:hypothetical protein